MTESVRVLVTGVSGGSIGEQVCKALRCGRHKYEIIATNVSLAPMGVIKADHYAVVPAAISAGFVETLLRLVKQFAVQFIIPGSEPELVVLSRHQQTFGSAEARLLINAPAVIDTCVDKVKTFEALAGHGFRVPETFVVDDVVRLNELPNRPPWIVKPAIGGGGSASAFIAQELSELHFFVAYLLRYGHRPLVQEYVGSADQEYTVGVLHNPAGNLMGTVVLHRQILSGLSNRLRLPNRTGRSDRPVLAISSGISQGRIVDSASVRGSAEAIAKALGSVGPMNIQGRWDGDGFVPFEINPRFSGTTPMRAMAGFNEPELLIDWHLRSTNLTEERSTDLRYGEFTRGIVEYFALGEGPA